MDYRKLLVVPFFIGVFLFVYSWFLTYPISISSAEINPFDKISIYYWISLPFLLVSMFLMAHLSRSNIVKWLLAIGIVSVLYSISYLYFSMPTSDSQYFRGLIEYFVQNKTLDPSISNHNYYQWPSFFILFQISLSESLLSQINFEFLIFFVIGLLLTTGLYVYASRVFKNAAFVAVIAFFISNMVLFLNYQAVPFSLALGFLLLIFMLESGKPSLVTTLTETLLYVGMLFVHAFVPLFFVIYCLGRGIFARSKKYIGFFAFTVVSYFMVQLSIARSAFFINLLHLFELSPEFSTVVEVTIETAPVNPIDAIAQIFSRFSTLGFIVLSLLGFLLLLKKRKINIVDKAVLLVGLCYSSIGLVLYTLGTRAVVIIFIPLTLGVAFLIEYKYQKLRRFFKPSILVLVIVLLASSMFIQVHQSFNYEIQFQTKEAYQTDNFLIDHLDWDKENIKVVMDYRSVTYFRSFLDKNVEFLYKDEDIFSLYKADVIFHNVMLSRILSYTNLTNNSTYYESFNRLYDNGITYIALNSGE